jgi:hypothetical protein
MRKVLVCAVVLFAQVARGTTYYVSTAGRDSNAGTSVSSPFRTIGKAMSVAQPGDTVYIRAGTYEESVATVRHGDQSRPIRFIADKAGTVFGKAGTIVLKPGTSNDGLIVRHHNLYFEGIRITSARSGIVVNNSVTQLVDMDVHRSRSVGVLVQNGVVLADKGRIRAGKGDGIFVKGSQSYVFLQNMSIYNNADDGIEIAPNAWIAYLRQCQIYGNRMHGVRAMGGIAVLLNCLVRSNSGNGVFCSMSSSSRSGAYVAYCTIARNTGSGVRVDGGAGRVYNSIVAFNRGAGMMRASTATLDHRYNCLYGNSLGHFAGDADGPGEIFSDPRFLSSSSYELQSASPAINSATATIIVSNDLAGRSRPQGGAYDMGAYEGTAAPIFTDVTNAVGFGATTTSREQDGSGFCWADIDADGDLDCIVSGTTARLMINNRAGASFSTVSLGRMAGQGAVLDANDDGRPDYVAPANGSGTVLLLNDENGLRVVPNSGLDGPSNTYGLCALDYNADGWADVLMFGTSGNRVGINGRSSSPTFVTSAPAEFNARGSVGNGDYCSTGDANGDGRADVLYHYDRGRLFESTSTNGYVLSRATGGSSATLVFETSPNRHIGSAWGDYDGDGDLDVFVSSPRLGGTGSLLENNGDGTYSLVSDEAGLVESDPQRGCAWGDFDNDGLLDLYVATQQNGCILYRNLGGGVLTPAGLGAEVNVNALDAVFVDYDNDGDLDIAITRVGAGMMLLRNNTNSNRYLKVRVLGAGRGGTNRLAIGTRVELLDAQGEVRGVRTIGGARGYAGTDPLWAHFGGVDPRGTYTVRVHFASGVVSVPLVPERVSTTIGSTVIRQMITVEEPPPVSSVRVVRWREASPEE